MKFTEQEIKTIEYFFEWCKGKNIELNENNLSELFKEYKEIYQKFVNGLLMNKEKRDKATEISRNRVYKQFNKVV